MKTGKAEVPSSLPRVPIAKLVGHDGPIQTLRFSGKKAIKTILLIFFLVCMLPMMIKYLALGQKSIALDDT